MERKTTFVVAGQLFETALNVEEVKKNIFTNTPVPVVLTIQTATKYPNIVLAPLTVENGIAYIDRDNLELVEDWVAKYEAEEKDILERQIQWKKDEDARLAQEEKAKKVSSKKTK